MRSPLAPSIPARVAASAGLLALLGVGACTTFYGLEPDASSSSSTSTGSGGSTPDERALLPLSDAAHLCALAARCPAVGAAIVSSIGLPIAEVGAGRDLRNYAACVDWLTFPMGVAAGADEASAARKGIFVARELVSGMTASSSCEDALRASFSEVIQPGDPRCAGNPAPYCDPEDSSVAVNCEPGTAYHCQTHLFPPNSDCATTAKPEAVCASGLCMSSEASCEAVPTSEHDYFYGCLFAGQKLLGVNCLALGLDCDDSAVTGAERGCYGHSGLARCTDDELGEQSCGGTRVLTCTGYAKSELDCSVVGEPCVEEGNHARCVRADAECSPYDATSNVCDGTSISLCNDGSRTTFDCATIGLSCVPGSANVTPHCG